MSVEFHHELTKIQLNRRSYSARINDKYRRKVNGEFIA